MSDDLYGNFLYSKYGDDSIVSNEKGDLFIRFRGTDYYTTKAGTKGDWLLRQSGDSILVRDSDGVAYARVADGDWYISSMPRIYNTSSSSMAAAVDTAGSVQEQSVTGEDNLSGAAWYDREWRKIAQEHPDWTEQQVTDKMSEQIWNAKYKLLINDIANSGSPEEREQKIREYQWELNQYKASGINVDNDVKYLRDTQGMETKHIFSKIAALTSKYSSDIIEPDPQSDAFVEDERRDRNSTWGISDDGFLYEGNTAGIPNSREMQKQDDRYKLYENYVQQAENLWEKVKTIQIGNSIQLTDADLEDGYQRILMTNGMTYVRARYEDSKWVIHPDDMQLAQETRQTLAKGMLIEAIIPGIFKVSWAGGKSLYKVLTKGPSKAINLSKSTNPKDFLDTALKRQGLETTPKELKEPWIEGDYKYEVRIHEANTEYGKTGSIYRVSRQRINTPEGQQGTGVEYMDTNGTWHHQSTLKPGKKGNVNPNYNDTAARETHIQIE